MRLVCCVWWCPSLNDLGHVRTKSLPSVWTAWKVAVRSVGSVLLGVGDVRSEPILKIVLGRECDLSDSWWRLAAVAEHLLPRLCSCSGLPLRGFGRGFHRARGTAVVTEAGPHSETTYACVPAVCFGVAHVVSLLKRCAVCPLKCHGWGMWHLASLQSAVYVRVYVTHLGGMGEDDGVGRECTTLDTSRGRRLYMDTNNPRA